MKTKNFRTKLNLACSNDGLRTVLQYISFDDGYAVATDAHILVKQSLKEHGFTKDEITIMNGKFLHKDAFVEIFRYDYVSVDINGFTCIKGLVKCIIGFSEIDGKYPIYGKIFENLKEEVLSDIGIDLNLLKKISQITISCSKKMKFTFHGTNKGILISPTGADSVSETILLMPIQIN